jgi:hypothetical protein
MVFLKKNEDECGGYIDENTVEIALLADTDLVFFK